MPLISELAAEVEEYARRCAYMEPPEELIRDHGSYIDTLGEREFTVDEVMERRGQRAGFEVKDGLLTVTIGLDQVARVFQAHDVSMEPNWLVVRNEHEGDPEPIEEFDVARALVFGSEYVAGVETPFEGALVDALRIAKADADALYEERYEEYG